MTTKEAKPARKRAATASKLAQRPGERLDEATQLRQRIASLLDTFEEQFKSQNLKVSVSDYIRLLQIKREFEEQKPKDIEVTWVDSLKEKDASGE